MEGPTLLTPTLHIEAALAALPADPREVHKLRQYVKQWVLGRNVFVKVEPGQMKGFGSDDRLKLVTSIEVTDYTGPPVRPATYKVAEHELDVQIYVLRAESVADGRRSIPQSRDNDTTSARVLSLPNVALTNEWDSLVFDDALPNRLLRYLTRMVGMMKAQGLNLAAFNWNRLCLLHGPPGSGKSTLCRALAQKLSIRLGDAFSSCTLVEINTNSMLSKYFGESGKLIGATFERIYSAAEDHNTLICVVMDEVETIAGSRERSTSEGECNDGLRATNQLLTALDRLRHLPNVIVLCTSNLISAIDQAFLDRVDIKQLIPSPSAAAVYNIYRSCLNELIRSSVVDATVSLPTPAPAPAPAPRKAPKRNATRPSAVHHSSSPNDSGTVRQKATSASSSLAKDWTAISAPEVPSFAEFNTRFQDQPESPGYRVWTLAQKCQGFSGRTLRRLPILGLAMYTWGGNITLDDAISALEAAVDQELKAVRRDDAEMKDA